MKTIHTRKVNWNRPFDALRNLHWSRRTWAVPSPYEASSWLWSYLITQDITKNGKAVVCCTLWTLSRVNLSGLLSDSGVPKDTIRP